MSGHPLSTEECDRLWEPWTPGEVAERLSGSRPCWYIAAGRYRLDVFREPHLGDQWVCRRDTSITMPYDELILHTADGIPYTIPEVVLLFKAKAARNKDEADFRHVLPALDSSRRDRLSEWLSRVHPGRPWLKALSVHR